MGFVGWCIAVESRLEVSIILNGVEGVYSWDWPNSGSRCVIIIFGAKCIGFITDHGDVRYEMSYEQRGRLFLPTLTSIAHRLVAGHCVQFFFSDLLWQEHQYEEMPGLGQLSGRYLIALPFIVPSCIHLPEPNSFIYVFNGNNVRKQLYYNAHSVTKFIGIAMPFCHIWFTCMAYKDNLYIHWSIHGVTGVAIFLKENPEWQRFQYSRIILSAENANYHIPFTRPVGLCNLPL